MSELEAASGALAGAIDQLRKLDRRLTRNGFREYSDSVRGALAELESVRQYLGALREETTSGE